MAGPLEAVGKILFGNPAPPPAAPTVNIPPPPAPVQSPVGTAATFKDNHNQPSFLASAAAAPAGGAASKSLLGQ